MSNAWSSWPLELSGLVELYKRARLVNPYTAYLTGPNADSVQKLAAAFPLLRRDPERVKRLIAELPIFLSVCEPVRLPPLPDKVPFLQHRDEHIAKFYADNKARLPEFSELFRDLALITASSAAAERVFSLFNNTFGKQQQGAYEDYIETALMLQYRNKPPTWDTRK